MNSCLGVEANRTARPATRTSSYRTTRGEPVAAVSRPPTSAPNTTTSCSNGDVKEASRIEGSATEEHPTAASSAWEVMYATASGPSVSYSVTDPRAERHSAASSIVHSARFALQIPTAACCGTPKALSPASSCAAVVHASA